jgi:hypothetical protein
VAEAATPLASIIESLHTALGAAELPHAFGGAMALGYCVEEPRATMDVDLNVFIGVDRIDELTRALPRAVAVTPTNRRELERDAQTRAWWQRTPIDLFLSNHPFHDRAHANTRRVPFGAFDDLPVLACADLAVFKAFFNRPKDAVDVAAMVTAGAVDLDALTRIVEGYLGDGRATFLARVREFAAG